MDDAGTCPEIGRLGEATLTVRVRNADGVVIAEDESRVLSELGRTLVAERSILDVSHGGTGGTVLAVGDQYLAASSDAGATWTSVDGVPPEYILDNVRHSLADRDVVLASGSYYEGGVVAGLFVSEDGGATLREVSHPVAGPYPGYVLAIALHPAERSTAFALVLGSYDEWQLYKTTNLGGTWTLSANLEVRGAAYPTMLIDPAAPERMFIGASGAVRQRGGYVSTDGGVSWSDWPGEAPEKVFSIDSEGRIYARRFVGETTSSPQQLVRSSDQGRTWKVLLEEDVLNVSLVSTFGPDVLAVVLAKNSNAGHRGLISFDDGASWEAFDLSPTNNTTFGRPNALDIVSHDGSVVEMVLSISGRRDPGHVWKLLFHRLGQESRAGYEL